MCCDILEELTTGSYREILTLKPFLIYKPICSTNTTFYITEIVPEYVPGLRKTVKVSSPEIFNSTLRSMQIKRDTFSDDFSPSPSPCDIWWYCPIPHVMWQFFGLQNITYSSLFCCDFAHKMSCDTLADPLPPLYAI